MLEYLKMAGVGPASELEINWMPRLNFVTGDNGLGKSFLLDVAWWVLTLNWARLPVVVGNGSVTKPRMSFRYMSVEGSFEGASTFDRQAQVWLRNSRGDRFDPPCSGIVVYAQADGGFSVWDPVRNKPYPDRSGISRLPGYLFTSDEVWDGLPLDSVKKVCNGLIQDWAAWQREKGSVFEQLKRVLRKLSPSPAETLTPGELRRISLDDVRDHPTLRMPYGQEVALVHASAAVRRIVALSYILVWTWQEHLRASELVDAEPARRITFLIDELEAHLHPRWQRRVVPTLAEVMVALTKGQEVSVQLVAATHSPLVLASVEPYFDPAQDAVWELDLIGEDVEFRRFEFRRHGDVNSWLTSSAFDLGEPRSLEAEEALAKANELLRRHPEPSLADVMPVDEGLRRVLSDVDRFWIRWSAFVEELRRAK